MIFNGSELNNILLSAEQEKKGSEIHLWKTYFVFSLSNVYPQDQISIIKKNNDLFL